MNGCFLGTFCVINGTLGQKNEGGGQRRRGKSEAEISLCSSLLGPVSQKSKEKEERDRESTRAHVPQTGPALAAGADSEKDRAYESAKLRSADFPGGPVAKNPPSNSGDSGLIPD